MHCESHERQESTNQLGPPPREWHERQPRATGVSYVPPSRTLDMIISEMQFYNVHICGIIVTLSAKWIFFLTARERKAGNIEGLNFKASII
eukprot:scaffold6719_cov97-Alexandrium_tamarense.AAC.1